MCKGKHGILSLKSQFMLGNVLQHYGINDRRCNILVIGNGLINNTWLVSYLEKRYILQKINNDVFKHPEDIDNNVSLLTNYFKINYPEYFFVSPVQSLNGDTMIRTEDGNYFRLSPFVTGSQTHLVTENPRQAYEAAKQFGKFTKLLSGIPMDNFKTVIPDFHNLSLRFKKFQRAIAISTFERRDNAKESISYLLNKDTIAQEYEYIIRSGILKKRIMHFDTKISNILFDQQDIGLCVIDLDTVMPGYFISDFGDMVRTYVSPVTEEEVDIHKVFVREDYFQAIVSGYLNQMGKELSTAEINYFVYAGKFMVYMQALRFLTDYLNNDIYYGAKYETHNLVRANNQIALLHSIIEKEGLLQKIVMNTIYNDVEIDKAFSN